jgi:hypothetical protein
VLKIKSLIFIIRIEGTLGQVTSYQSHRLLEYSRKNNLQVRNRTMYVMNNNNNYRNNTY